MSDASLTFSWWRQQPHSTLTPHIFRLECVNITTICNCFVRSSWKSQSKDPGCSKILQFLCLSKKSQRISAPLLPLSYVVRMVVAVEYRINVESMPPPLTWLVPAIVYLLISFVYIINSLNRHHIKPISDWNPLSRCSSFLHPLSKKNRRELVV